MENNSFQTSFIPKKPITSSVSSREPKSLFTIITTFVLVLSIIIPIGLYFYKNFLTAQKAELSASLKTAEASFERNTIDELGIFDKRIEISKQVLNKHIILSPMFSRLGEITIPAIQYTKFSHQTSDKGFAVSIEGVARDYKSIALQAGMFGSAKGSSFKNVLFYNLTKDKSNNVSFSLTFSVDPGLLSYKNELKSNPLPQDLDNNTQ